MKAQTSKMKYKLAKTT